MIPALQAEIDNSDSLSRAVNARHIPKLDALRAVSALLVMLYHFGLPIPAGLGVTCFFVISGFLITRLLLDEYRLTSGVSLRKFYARRAFRIFPAFYVYWFVITGWLAWTHGHIIWGQVVSSFFYVCNYYQGTHHYPSSGYSRTWSLGVEEQFYLLWPLLFSRMVARPGRLLKVLGGTIAGIWILRVLLVVSGVDEAYLYTAFECRADAILVGCALAISLHYGFFPKAWRRLCRYRAGLVITLGMLCASLPLYRFGTVYRDVCGDILEPLLIAAIIVQLLSIEWRGLDWLDSKPVRFFGLISYSTYLYHGLYSFGPSAPLVLRVIPSYVLAAISYLAVEKPFLRLRDRVVR